MLSTISVLGMQPVWDYASRHKKEIAAGVGAAALAGATYYYGKQQGENKAEEEAVKLGGDDKNAQSWTWWSEDKMGFLQQPIKRIQIKNLLSGKIDLLNHNEEGIVLLINKRAATPEDLNKIFAEVTFPHPGILKIETKYRASKVNALIDYKLKIPRQSGIQIEPVTQYAPITYPQDFN